MYILAPYITGIFQDILSYIGSGGYKVIFMKEKIILYYLVFLMTIRQ